jgi:hypothetical protein
MVPWYVTQPGEDLEDVVSAYIWYLRRQINLIAPPGYTDARHATYKVFGQDALGRSEEEALQELTANRMVVIADVEGSKQAVEDFFAAGATEIIGQFEVGGISQDLILGTMTRFAQEVVGMKPMAGAGAVAEAKAAAPSR